MYELSLAGKVALVTGAGSGIGRGCAEALAQAGASVLVTDLPGPGGPATAEAITAAGGTARFAALDVTDEAAWERVVAECVAGLGGLHVMVANAGIGVAGDIADFTLADWRRQTAVNIDGVFLGTKHSIRHMRDHGGGAIVMISSVAGLKGAPHMAGYAATKGAVRLFAKSAALECARRGYGIRVNSVHPGIIETAIWTKIPNKGDVGERTMDPRAIAERSVPLGVTGHPEDIGAAVVWLASDAARHVTGTELVVDGGMTA